MHREGKEKHLLKPTILDIEKRREREAQKAEISKLSILLTNRTTLAYIAALHIRLSSIVSSTLSV